MALEFNIIRLIQAGSTNKEASRLAQEQDGNFAVVAQVQTAGRGQRGNVWESAPGANLTVSLLIRHYGRLLAREQFRFCEAMALAVADTVEQCGGGTARVKWPNDVYADGDGKIAGLLIEHSVSGAQITRSVVGIGLNVNQTAWEGDAPNPVSLRQITGRCQNLDEVLRILLDNVEARYAAMGEESQHAEYIGRQWRSSGFHPYRLPLEGAVVEAEIADISSEGILTLRHLDGRLTRHAFKEALAIIPGRR